jgi:hypothetical protein
MIRPVGNKMSVVDIAAQIIGLRFYNVKTE